MIKRSHPLIFALLFPFSLVYGFMIYCRNLFFDWGWLVSRQFKIPVICIGNLTVGGTGKTPHAEYLIGLLKEEFVVALLSRGYNRKSKGFRLADENSTADDIGDEPMQIKKKFINIIVAVSESRVKGIQTLLKIHPEIDVIILDDAFQHRYVEAGMNILLIDFNRPLQKEFMLPAGNLREHISGKERANLFVISKTPATIKPIDKRLVMKAIVPRPYQSIYFSSLIYRELNFVFPNGNPAPNLETLKTGKYKVLLVTGIANPAMLIAFFRDKGIEVITMTYRDHYAFNDDDLVDIYNKFETINTVNKLIVTTEKDAMRFKKFVNIAGELKNMLFYIPVEVVFINSDAELFNNQIVNYVRKSKRNNLFYSKQNKIST
jgi:tetraacyldisaccharide 4'-kinase